MLYYINYRDKILSVWPAATERWSEYATIGKVRIYNLVNVTCKTILDPNDPCNKKCNNIL